MKIGCFALIQPFSPMRRQFELIRVLGFDYADLTDNHDGATLGTEVGIEAIVRKLLAIGFDGPTTLEISGEDAVKTSAGRLRQWAAA